VRRGACARVRVRADVLPLPGLCAQFSERLASFKSQTERGESGAGASDDAAAGGAPRGVHQNTITAVRCVPGGAAGFAFSTSGTDGRLALWAADAALAARLGSLTLA
jgi:hypothetical protein